MFRNILSACGCSLSLISKFKIKKEESVFGILGFSLSLISILISWWLYVSSEISLYPPKIMTVYYSKFSDNQGNSDQFIEFLMTVSAINTGRNARDAIFIEQELNFEIPGNLASRCPTTSIKNKIILSDSIRAFDLNFSSDGRAKFKSGETAAPFFVKPGEAYVQTVLFRSGKLGHFMKRSVFECWVREYDNGTFNYKAIKSTKNKEENKTCNVNFKNYRDKLGEKHRNFIAFACENNL